MSYTELLQGLSARLGGEIDFTPDDAGAVTLSVDDMSLTILGLEEVGQVVLSGIVGEPPPEDRLVGLYKALLEANHNFACTAGATLALDPQTGKVSLCKVLPLALLDGESFFQEIERFINVLETWCELVRNYRDATTAAPVADEPAQPGLMAFRA